MQPFTFQNLTTLVFGRGRIAELSTLVPAHEKILVCFGGGSVKRNGVYDQVKAALQGFDTLEFWGIEPNPKVETLEKAIRAGREAGVTFVLAVGGGSVLDGVKLIACALADKTERPAWDLVLSRRPEASLPYASVMTVPATGSEMNQNSVVSRLETQEKLSWVTPRFPEFSILDPDCIKSLSMEQRRASIADIIAHTLEQYLTQPGQSRLMDRWAEGILLTMHEITPALMTPIPADDVLDEYMLAATLALNEMICMGVNQDWATHAIGHEITALTGLAHGASLAIVYPALLRVRFGLKRAKLAQMGERVFGLKGEETQVAQETICALETWFRQMGLATRLPEANIDESVDQEIVRRFDKRQWKLGEDRAMSVAAIRDVLRTARMPYEL